MTIEELKASNAIILECISGSKAYGLNTALSDTDIRGVFILPKEKYFGLQYTDQVSDEKNDVVYYELGKFISLLCKNNPNILELLNMPEDCVLYRHAIMDLFDKDKILSKLSQHTFVNYAYSQITKAHGLNKKIMNPMDEQRKTILDFCYVYEGKVAMPLTKYLNKHQYAQEHIGLAAITHFRDCYNLYYNPNAGFKGIMPHSNANEVSVSSVPKEEPIAAILYFNKDGYSMYCKDYREYWDWVAKRNASRYESTISHGKNYDAKNIMHTYRLLMMAKDIATKKEIIVRRPEREFLLDIKAGKFEYNELLANAETLKAEVNTLFEESDLQAEVDAAQMNALCVAIREQWYK